MILAHRIQLRPTGKQAHYFSRAYGPARFTWNWTLAEWDRQYAAGLQPKAAELKRQFNAIKYERFPWLKGIHRDAHAQPFAQIAAAWRNFLEGRCERKKKGKCQDSFYFANDKFRIGPNGISLPIIGAVQAREHLRFNGEVQGAVVSMEADRWFISVTVDPGEPDSDVPPGVPVGADLGISVFAKLSTGEEVFAPKPLKKAQARLRRLNRRLARTPRASKNHRKAALRLARQHKRVRNIRRDFLHKFTTKLAKNHSEICMDNLNV
jgi:putative transposase